MPLKLLRSVGRRLLGKRGPSSASGKPASSSATNARRGRSASGASRSDQAGSGDWRPGDPRPARESRDRDRPPRKRSSSSSSRRRRPEDGERRAGDRPSGERRSASTERSDRPPSSAPRKRRSRSRGSRGDGSRPPRKVQAPVFDPVPEAWDPASYEVAVVDDKTRFHDVDLPRELMYAIAQLGFEYCTPVQAEVLTRAGDGQNVAGQAQTGTGKTAAFLLSIMKQFLRGAVPGERAVGTPRALVIAPTRELVIQIAKDGHSLGRYAGIHVDAVYGGMDYTKQQENLQAHPVDILAATPGRLLDFARRGVLDLGKVEVLVIDEADRMLDMGFIPDVRRIVQLLPRRENRRSMLFSATLSDDVRRLAAQWVPDPVEIDIEPEQVTVDTVDQIIYTVTARQKFDVLMNMLKDDAMERVLVFGNRRDRTQRLADRLQRAGISSALLSGAVDQKKRLRILEDFRAGKVRVLVATDVAGRGIHIDNITHVINYEFPYEAEDYVHRIGRTGRAGQGGIAVSFACEDESFIIPDIEKYIGRDLPCSQPDEALLVTGASNKRD